MHQVITATYENGVLRPEQALPLHNQQQVVLIVLPVSSPAAAQQPDPARVATMQKQVEAWLNIQPDGVIRPPLPEIDQTTLTQELTAALSQIRTATGEIDEAQLLAEIETALAEVQALSPAKAAALDAELTTILAE